MLLPFKILAVNLNSLYGSHMKFIVTSFPLGSSSFYSLKYMSHSSLVLE